MRKKLTDVIKEQYRDSDGYWIYLKTGYQCGDDLGTHGIVEDTKRRAMARLSSVIPCDCADCKQQPDYATTVERFYVSSALQSSLGRKVVDPHRVIDRQTGSTLDQYASKRAAASHARQLNADAAAGRSSKTVAGVVLTLVDGVRYRASRPFSERGRTVYPVTIERLDAPVEDVQVVGGLSYAAADALVNEFNNGSTSFDGRIW